MKRVWNEHLDNILRRNYPKGDLDALARRMGMTIGAIKCRACVLGLEKPNMFVYGGGDDVAEWCKQYDVVHVKEYMNRGRE